MSRLFARIAIALLIVVSVAAPVAAAGPDNPIVVGTAASTPAALGPDSPLAAPSAASPAATPATSGAAGTLDLAAMSLQPADIKMPGAGFALGQSLYYGLDFYDPDVQAEFKKDNFQLGYKNGLYRTNPDEEVWCTLVQFAQPQDADKALSYWTDQAHRETASKTYGDRSVIISYTTHDNSDTTATVALNLRVGNLFAIVELDNYAGQKPDVAQVEQLGDTFVRRINAARSLTPPILSLTAIRLTPPASGIAVENRVEAYYRLNGNDFPIGGEKEEDELLRVASFGKATTVYEVFQGLGPNEANSDAVGFELTLLAFPDQQTASDWIDGYVVATGQSGTDMLVYDQPAGAPSFGDQSLFLSYHLTDQDNYSQYGTSAWRDAGIILLARYGKTGVMIQTHRDSTAQVDELAPIMQAQAACLRSSAICAPIPVPAALIAMVHAASGGGSGTPAASS